MTLMNFESDLEMSTMAARRGPPIVRRERSATELLADTWDWRVLRDYVMGWVESRFGKVPRGDREIGIFKGFSKRWGDLAPEIARYAMEDCAGTWAGRPVTELSFCANSDPYFARPIAARLRQ